MNGFGTHTEHMRMEDEDMRIVAELVRDYDETNKAYGNLRRGFSTPDEIKYLVEKAEWEDKEIRGYLVAVPPGAPISKWETPLPSGGEYPSFGYQILYGWLNHGNLQGKMIEIYQKSKFYNPNNKHMIVTWVELNQFDLEEIANEVAMDLQKENESHFWQKSYRMVNEDLAAMELAKQAVGEGYRIFYTCDTQM
jgi:hypothetical protein